jgi:arabinogalactan endo-1,4-beta-galactosidase
MNVSLRNLKTHLNIIILVGLFAFVSSCDKSEPIVPPVIVELPSYLKACDLSFLPEMRLDGVAFKNTEGQLEDPLETLKKQGMNAVRLRLWNGQNGLNTLENVKTYSDEIKSKGLLTWITVHYSDTWADPGSQTKPASWSNASFEVLKDSIYEFTYKAVLKLKPDYIQIGNEINSGLLWPEGHSNNSFQMRALLAEGIRACRNASPATKIIIHYAGYQYASIFYAGLQNLNYDIIALSYYPIWHGKDMKDLENKMIDLKETYKKEVIIAETSYPFTFDWADWTNNIIGGNNQIVPTIPATADGQKVFLTTLNNHIKQAEGFGWCYWGAEWVASKGDQASNGSSWENQALWDFDFKALPAVTTFKAD